MTKRYSESSRRHLLLLPVVALQSVVLVLAILFLIFPSQRWLVASLAGASLIDLAMLVVLVQHIELRPNSVLGGNQAKASSFIPGSFDDDVIEQMPVALVCVDGDGLIEKANRRACKLFSWEPTVVVRKHVRELLPTLGQTIGLPENPGTRTVKSNHEGRRSNGEIFPARVHMRPLDDAGGGKSLIAVEDLSKEYELERMKETFIAMVSHDMKSPLTTVHGMLVLLSRGVYGVVSEEAHNQLGVISEQIDRLIRLINELLQIEKLSSGTFSVELKAINIVEIVQPAMAAVEIDAVGKNISIALDTEAAAQGWVLGDSDRLIQVLVNLMNNAIKYSNSGSTITVECSASEHDVEVSVTDEGRGIPAEALPHIFDKYRQVDAVADAKRGVGLGLAICKSLVEQHGGTIRVSSEEGHGSRFWFSLPRIDCTQQNPAPAAAIND